MLESIQEMTIEVHLEGLLLTLLLLGMLVCGCCDIVNDLRYHVSTGTSS